MHLTKAQENALLFALYVARAGRARVQDAAEDFNVSHSFLEQIARKMRIGGVLSSVRGPGGGYTLTSNPTVLEVLSCVDFRLPDLQTWLPKSSESRALIQYTKSLRESLSPLLRRRIQSLNLELAANEVAVMNRINADKTIN